MSFNGWGISEFGDSNYGRYNDRETYHERSRGGGWDNRRNGGRGGGGRHSNYNSYDNSYGGGFWHEDRRRNRGGFSSGGGGGGNYFEDNGNELGSWHNSSFSGDRGGVGGSGYDNYGRSFDTLQLEPEDYNGIGEFQKNFYTPNNVVKRSFEDYERFKFEKEISLEPAEGPPPAITFNEVGFPGKIELLKSKCIMLIIGE